MSNAGFERYDDYIDSGVEWIGKMPAHWEVKRVKDELSSLDYKRIPLSAEVRGKMTEQSYDYYGASGVIDKVEDYIFNESTILIGEDGANLYSRSSPLAFIATGKYWVNNHAHILKPKRGNIHFFCYLLEAFDYTTLISGSAQPKLTAGQLNRILLMVPTPLEQVIIANYLDTKTTQIDRQIDLLSKKSTQYNKLKQSLINETVTRGLDKTVAMKGSGVEWIGEIPAHWEVKRLKELFTESKRVSTTGEEILLSVSEYTGVTQKKDNIVDDEFITRALTLVGYKLCEINDLVINIMLAWKRGLGISPSEGIVSPSYAVYTPSKNISPFYFHYLLRIEDCIAEFKRNSTGIIESRLRLYTDSFYDISVAVPPVSEQQAISDYLDSKTAHISRIVSTINTQVDKLKELRKTVINDVVTGKIKVA